MTGSWQRLWRSLWAAVVLASAVIAGSGAARAVSPYPTSAYITSFTPNWLTYRSLALGSDLWPTTWAADGYVYSTWGDGGGFGTNSEALAYVSIGIARITGTTAATLVGQNLISGLNYTLPGAKCFPLLPGATPDNRTPQPATVMPCQYVGLHGKSSSILALDTSLYLWVNPRSGNQNLKEARLYRSTIGTNVWTRASWAFTPADKTPLVEPVFLQAGQNYGAITDYVYAYAARYAPTSSIWLQKGPAGGSIVLMRAPRLAGTDLLQRANWRFYAGKDTLGVPVWSPDQNAAVSVFTDPDGVGFANPVIYVPALARYLLLTQHTVANTGQIGLFESKQPWGPWYTVFYGTLQNRTPQVKAFTFFADFLANSFSADGLHFTLTFTGKKKLDGLNLVDASLTVKPPAR